MKKGKEIVLTDHQIETALFYWMERANRDEVAKVIGTIFGGKCVHFEDWRMSVYKFEPNENYWGEFD